ncbi:uncharacterized protein METZ01_LOCUS162385, partial [marine metagenome]
MAVLPLRSRLDYTLAAYSFAYENIQTCGYDKGNTAKNSKGWQIAP